MKRKLFDILLIAILPMAIMTGWADTALNTADIASADMVIFINISYFSTCEL